MIASLIQDKEHRLCSKRYRFKDLVSPPGSSAHDGLGLGLGSHGNARAVPPKQQQKINRDFAGRYVFPYDAEDIKAHKWFKGVPWGRLHQIIPPHVPQLRAVDDTRYFDEEEEISDWSDSESETSDSEQQENCDPETKRGPCREAAVHLGPGPVPGPSLGPFGPSKETVIVSDARSRAKLEEARLALRGLRRSVQKWALAAIATPYDTARLRNIEVQIENMEGLSSAERATLREFMRLFGRRDRKRPRDRLLRDKNTRSVVMEVRKKTAFLGYTWRRMHPLSVHELSDTGGPAQAEKRVGVDVGLGRSDKVLVVGEDEQRPVMGVDGGGGADYGSGWADVSEARALHRGRMSLR